MTTAISTTPEAGNQASIALVSFDSLGDGLIYLMMADNLQRNGFDVTCYGAIAHQMRAWLPNLKVRPYPPAEQMEAEFAGYDLAIVSPPGFIRSRMDEDTTTRLREKWLLICQKAPESWRFDHTERIRRSCSPDKFAQLRGLLDCSGSIRFRKCADASVVAITQQFMREKMHLADVTREPPIAPPPGLVYRRHRRRVVVSPDSAGPEKKDWRPASFLRLCHELKNRGLTPEIVVAPRNHETWAKMKGNDFNTPRFDNVGDLCAYLYESGVVVANDSGNGHLASFLGIPVVTIYRKKNPLFHWRPDWKRGIVVCPVFALPGQKTPFWKHFVRSSQIVAAVEQLQGSHEG